MKRPEILAPAGDMERLRTALLYGADAVYLAGRNYGMRSACANFTNQQLEEAVGLAHRCGVRVYVTCNTLARNGEIDRLPAFLEMVQHSGADGLIVADLGVIALAKQYAPRCALHISTQTGIANYAAARAVYELGAKRAVLARELSLDEIAEIRAKVPAELELEAFVHGSMCMSWSGRCLLSSFLTGRDGGRGDCAQPCRWSYQLIEPGRPGQPMTVEEHPDGTYIFNANDLCMIEHIAALAGAGISSMKIEGRAKAAYYTAVTTNAYRMAAAAYEESGFSESYRPEQWVAEELEKVSHRPYGTGFYFGAPSQNTRSGGYIRSWEVAAIVTGYHAGQIQLRQRNRFYNGESLEVLEPGRPPFTIVCDGLSNEDGEPVAAASHADMELRLPYPHPLTTGAYLRKRVKEVSEHPHS